MVKNWCRDETVGRPPVSYYFKASPLSFSCIKLKLITPAPCFGGSKLVLLFSRKKHLYSDHMGWWETDGNYERIVSQCSEWLHTSWIILLCPNTHEGCVAPFLFLFLLYAIFIFIIHQLFNILSLLKQLILLYE